jgi:hypothetical protein
MQLLSRVLSLFLKGVVIFPIAKVIGGGIGIYELDE